MTSIPANLARVPNLLRSSQLQNGITRTNLDLLLVQDQLASGKAVGKFSDDPIAASAINVLRERLARGDQTIKNLSSAQATLDYLDTSVGDVSDLVREASSVASGQIGVTSDASTRNTQAVVIDGYIRQLFQLSNRSTNGVYVFGGATSTRTPIEELAGGYRYTGHGTGQFAELGSASDVPVTVGGDDAIGEVSARVKSTKNLDPDLSGSTRLSDLRGGRGLGISKGPVTFSFNGGPTATVDFSNADTVQDVLTVLTSAIRTYESANSTTILGPSGVTTAGGTIRIDVVSGTPTNPQLTFADAGQGVTGKDLGLTQASFSTTSPTSSDLDPKLTLLTPLAAVPGLTVPLGTVRFRFTSGASSSVTDVDLSGATTIDQLRNLVENQAPGVRVQINSAGTGIDVLNEVGGPALSIEPVGTTVDTASELGIRTTDFSTKVADLNDGRGVRIVDNKTDPVSGLKTRQYNTDFRVYLGTGQAFDVDLRPQDLADVQSVLNRLNSEFAAAVLQPPVVASAPALTASQFGAGLAASGNGITLTQTTGGGPIRVEQQNNSAAAEDLGLSSGTSDLTGATFTAQDRGAVRVNNLFTSLIRLRDALRSNDSTGITLAGQELGASVDRLSSTQALVGVYANRVKDASSRQTDENTVNEKMRSELQDLDYTSATIRFNTLRTQLQAAYQTGSTAHSLSLLDFLR